MKDSKPAGKPKNNKWVANREKEWEKVKVRLPGIEGLNRDDWWDVEEHFFRGKPLPPYSRSFQPMDRLVLSWWLAPERVEFADTAASNIKKLRRDFRHFYSSLYDVVALRGGDADYGAMGGIEQDIILFLQRGWNPRKLVDFGDGRLQPCCSEPMDMFGY